MSRTRTLLALALVQFLALAALAQSNEFARSSGGEIEAIIKTPSQFSGSLSLTHSTGAFGGQRYEGAVGGELVHDRLWFFGTASVLPRTQFSTSTFNATSAKATAQPVDWSSVTASFRQLRQPVLGAIAEPVGVTPSSFLSLRSTSILSSNMTLDVSMSRRTSTGQ